MDKNEGGNLTGPGGPMSRLPAILVTATLGSALGLAQSVPGGPQSALGLAGALYRYEPNAGQQEAHAQAYRRHLEWHQIQNDPLDWYGWRVETGPRRGDFVDGTFGLPWSAFDARIKPAEDGADFAATAGPLARLTDHVYLEFLPECSRWKNGSPAPILDVYTVEGRPGQGPRLEAFLRGSRDRVPGDRGWYRVVNGGTSPSYLVMIPRRDASGWPDGERYWRQLSEIKGAALGTWIRGIRSESWRFLPDLSLLHAVTDTRRP
jgi:hypothetical protein